MVINCQHKAKGAVSNIRDSTFLLSNSSSCGRRCELCSPAGDETSPLRRFINLFLILRQPLYDYTFSKACAISAIRSSLFSRPQDRRIRSAPTPAASKSASDICRWVELAGWRQQVRESATWVSIEPSFKCFIKVSAPFLPDLRPKEITPQEPFGRYFCASA